jgi:hypothetical protein
MISREIGSLLRRGDSFCLARHFFEPGLRAVADETSLPWPNEQLSTSRTRDAHSGLCQWPNQALTTLSMNWVQPFLALPNTFGPPLSSHSPLSTLSFAHVRSTRSLPPAPVKSVDLPEANRYLDCKPFAFLFSQERY